ncbi:hypothetical protein NA78x_002812 [Anatilimnocola sp. NA78]|uniref:hypothetical protein n=1 Tax=Anatilimnocola sp. NA78 TaxID=3415683 RepID=UPI003CE56FC5
MAKDKYSLELSPEERRHELAELLARGLIRLHLRRATQGQSAEQPHPEKALDSGLGGLEVSAETVLSVHTG